MHSFFFPLGPIRIDLGPGVFPYQDLACLQPILGSSPCVGISSLVSNSMCTPLSCLSGCVTNSTTILAPYGEEAGPSEPQKR